MLPGSCSNGLGRRGTVAGPLRTFPERGFWRPGLPTNTDFLLLYLVKFSPSSLEKASGVLPVCPTGNPVNLGSAALRVRAERPGQGEPHGGQGSLAGDHRRAPPCGEALFPRSPSYRVGGKGDGTGQTWWDNAAPRQESGASACSSGPDPQSCHRVLAPSPGAARPSSEQPALRRPSSTINNGCCL